MRVREGFKGLQKLFLYQIKHADRIDRDTLEVINPTYWTVYRNHAGQRTGVRSFFKSCRSSFFFAPRCDNADGCDNADTGAETKLNHFVLSFSAPPVR